MKIVFYGRHQVGQFVLLHLLALGHRVRVLTPEDKLIAQVCAYHDIPIITLDELDEYDFFISVHGKKIIPAKYLMPTKFINLHPCLRKYPGKDPIKRYIHDEEKLASVSSHFMTEKVDAGEVIFTTYFVTTLIHTREQFYMVALPRYLECIQETLNKLDVKRTRYA